MTVYCTAQVGNRHGLLDTAVWVPRTSATQSDNGHLLAGINSFCQLLQAVQLLPIELLTPAHTRNSIDTGPARIPRRIIRSQAQST